MKHIIFDFDGTLTEGKGNIWKNIYKTLGYSVEKGSKYKNDLVSFLEGNLSYNDWCKINASDYRRRKLTKNTIDTLAQDIRLFSDAIPVVRELCNRGYNVHIVSGNIGYVIDKVLGENKAHFTSIKANEFTFDGDRFLDIIPTKYDCEGKALFVQELMASGVDRGDIYFVGNGINDEWVASTGCKTICINPEDTDATNTDIWCSSVETLTEILDIVR